MNVGFSGFVAPRKLRVEERLRIFADQKASDMVAEILREAADHIEKTEGDKRVLATTIRVLEDEEKNLREALETALEFILEVQPHAAIVAIENALGRGVLS